MANTRVIELLEAHRRAVEHEFELRVEIERRTGMTPEAFTEGMRALLAPVETPVVEDLPVCLGHESTNGPIGNVEYCDGSCFYEGR